MKIIISPAKKMTADTGGIKWKDMPCFLDETKELKEWLCDMDDTELQKLWKCSGRITAENVERLKVMDLEKGLTPALTAYEGIQYQYMAPQVFSEDAWAYVQEHLRILSGFYGVLRPLDGVVPYRLEMQAKPGPAGYRTLYDYWGEKPYKALTEGGDMILNLASKEYSRCIEKYIGGGVRFLTCVFAVEEDGKRRQKATPAKMARGEMVRYLAENGITDVDGIRKFNGLGFVFSKEASTDDTLTFIRKDCVDGKDRYIYNIE